MARAINTATISFGLVSVPIKVYAANSALKVSFNTLTPSGNKVKQQYVDAVSGEVIDRKLGLKGYEYTKGKFVTFTPEELKQLESQSDKSIEIKEFVPAEEIDSVRVEKSFYLGTDGGEKSYTLLARVMEDNWVVAIAQWKSRGRDHLVVIRPYREDGMLGLAMQQIFYHDEVRDFKEVAVAGCDASEAEIELAGKLVESLRVDTFDLSKYKDHYTDRLQDVVDQKVAGKDITVSPVVPGGASVIDLYDALKQSLGQNNGPPTASVDN
jgi:DNA end-binding protein Ku